MGDQLTAILKEYLAQHAICAEEEPGEGCPCSTCVKARAALAEHAQDMLSIADARAEAFEQMASAMDTVGRDATRNTIPIVANLIAELMRQLAGNCREAARLIREGKA